MLLLVSQEEPRLESSEKITKPWPQFFILVTRFSYRLNFGRYFYGRSRDTNHHVSWSNFVPRVFRLFVQRLVFRRDSGDIEFYYRRISAVKQWKPLRNSQSENLNFFEVPRVSPGAHPLTKKPEDSGYEIGHGPAAIFDS